MNKAEFEALSKKIDLPKEQLLQIKKEEIKMTDIKMKKAYFYIDDTIWVLRDITRQNPKSLFDNPFMNMLKTAHDKYGLKTQLNLFYRTDYFSKRIEFTCYYSFKRRSQRHLRDFEKAQATGSSSLFFG